MCVCVCVCVHARVCVCMCAYEKYDILTRYRINLRTSIYTIADRVKRGVLILVREIRAIEMTATIINIIIVY